MGLAINVSVAHETSIRKEWAFTSVILIDAILRFLELHVEVEA